MDIEEKPSDTEWTPIANFNLMYSFIVRSSNM